MVTKVIAMYRFIEPHQGEVNDSKVVFTVNTAVKAHSSLIPAWGLQSRYIKME